MRFSSKKSAKVPVQNWKTEAGTWKLCWAQIRFTEQANGVKSALHHPVPGGAWNCDYSGRRWGAEPIPAISCNKRATLVRIELFHRFDLKCYNMFFSLYFNMVQPFLMIEVIGKPFLKERQVVGCREILIAVYAYLARLWPFLIREIFQESVPRLDYDW